MANRVLDTNVLITIWRGKTPGIRRPDSEVSARAAAETWLRLSPDDVILTPVRIEFPVGARDRDELRLYDAFLGVFRVLDDGRVLPLDWRVAERFARRIPHDGRFRDAVDCLILAICDRLNAELRTDDTSMGVGQD